MFEKIKNLKIKICKSNLKKDFFLIDIKDSKKLKQLLQYNKIPFYQKMGFIILSKIYLLELLKFHFYIENIGKDFNHELEYKTIDTIFKLNRININLEDDYICLNSIKFKNDFNFSLNLLIKKIMGIEKNIIIDFKYKDALTIVFNDSYNRLIDEFVIEDDNAIIKVFSIFKFNEVKISKIIKNRIFDQIESDLLDGYSINIKDFEFNILRYSPTSDELCIQLENIHSGKKIIIYPITFDPNTGLLTKVGQDLSQLRLI